LEAEAHQDLPFEKLVEALQPERDLSVTPLFQVMFTLQNMEPATLRLSNMELSAVRVERQAALFDLNLDMTESRFGLTAELEFNADLFYLETMARLLDHFGILLQGVVANPAGRLSDLPLLTEQESRQVLVEWRGGAIEHHDSPLVHHLIA